MASGMATRCSACGTVFRVVADQLRVSEGWVRCGRCSEVFNAAEALVDLDTGAPRAPTPVATPRAMMSFGGSRQPVAPAPPPAPAPAPPLPAADDFSLDLPPGPEVKAASPPMPMPMVEESVSRFADDAADAPHVLPATGNPDATAATTSAAEDITADPRPTVATTPSFVRRAERAARWRRPRVRLALAAALVLGCLALVSQVTYEYRDLVSARFPGLRPALQQACAALGCQVGPAHLIDGLVVESSGLVRVEKSNLYRLSVALRNRDTLELALPALELSLTDAQGQLVARRVITTAELGVNTATLAGGRELSLQATLQAATAPVAGYTIELFYP